MMDLNKIELMGHLTADPDIRGSEKAVACAKLRMATNGRASGKDSERTEYHSVVMFGRLATTAQRYLRKGDRLYIDGRIRTNAWVAKDGTRRRNTEIVARNIIMLGGKLKNDDVAVEEIDTDQDGEG